MCIGETRRSMKKRLTEHRYAVKTRDPKNGIAVHVQSPSTPSTGEQQVTLS